MAETVIEKYRRVLTEAKAVAPKPVTPIEGLDLDIADVDGLKIMNMDAELPWQDVRKKWKGGEKVHPSVVLTDAKMDALCTFWLRAKELAK